MWTGPERNITDLDWEKKFTLAKKVYNRGTLTLIGHPYSSARIQTKLYQLKGWIRTKRALNGGKKMVNNNGVTIKVSPKDL